MGPGSMSYAAMCMRAEADVDANQLTKWLTRRQTLSLRPMAKEMMHCGRNVF